MKKMGRKWTMLSLVVPFTIGWALVIWAQNFMEMFIGRFLIGLAGGAFCISAPQYTAEIAETNIRGTLGSFMELMIVCGTIFVYSVGAGFSVFWISVFCGMIPLIFGAVFIWMPESPTYLVEKGKYPKAVASIKWLRGEEYDPEVEIEDLKDGLLEELKGDATFHEIMSSKANKKALHIGLGLMIIQEMSAINIVVFYATKIFEGAGAFISPDLCTIFLGCLNLVATIFCCAFVDKLGRKIFLLISITGMILCLFSLGLFFYLLDYYPSSVENLKWLPLASLSIYMIAFSLGIGPIPWLILGEIFSNDLKPFAAPICGFINWFIGFLITFVYGSLSAAIGIGQTFWLFAVINFFGIFFIVFMVPETKGKSLPEIQKMLVLKSTD